MAEPQPQSLTAKTVRGAAWTLPTTLVARVVGLVGTLLLARYLDPGEYGEVMAAAIVTITAFAVSTFGVGIFVLSNRDLSRREVFQATAWFVATGLVALGLVWLAAHPLGDALDAPHMADHMPIFVISAVCDRVAFMPERILIRELRFRWLSIARLLSELVFTAVTLGCAHAGYGPESIGWGYLARAVLKLVLIVGAVAWRDWIEPHRIDRAVLARIVRSGVTVSIAGIASFLMRRWDNLIISAFYGHAAMGAYNYAYNLADTPAVAIGEQISDVVAASFPHAEGAKRQAAAVRACTMVSLIMFPLAFGLAAVADTVVETFFDAKWAAVGGMLSLLAILSAPRPIAHILHSYLFAAHRQRLVLILEWTSLAILVLALVSLGSISLEWACIAVGAAFVVRTLLVMWSLQRVDGIAMTRFLIPLIRPLIACVAMVVAIHALRPLIGDLAPAWRLLIEIGCGAVIYALGALVIFRGAAREMIDLLRSGLRR